MYTNLALFLVFSISFRHGLLLEAVVVLSIIHLLNNNRPQTAGQKVLSFGAPLVGFICGWFLFKLNQTLALAASTLVNKDQRTLNLTEHAECTVQQLVGHPLPDVLDPEGALVGREAHAQIAAVVQLTVELALCLLGVFAIIHAKEGKVLIIVDKSLLALAEGLQHFTQRRLVNVRGQVTDVEPRPAGELLL